MKKCSIGCPQMSLNHLASREFHSNQITRACGDVHMFQALGVRTCCGVNHFPGVSSLPASGWVCGSCPFTTKML